MVGYVIVEIDVQDAEGYKEYTGPAAETVGAFGGRYLVRGGKTVSLEGDWEPKRIVVLEFESVERALEWWHSEEYGPVKEIRYRTAHSRMIAVQGV